MTMDIQNLTMESVSKGLGLVKTDVPAFANKYVVYERDGMEFLRLGEPIDTHAEMVPKGRRAVAAGFYRVQGKLMWNQFDNDGYEIFVSVFGYSESLGLTSRPSDAALIKNMLAR